MRWFEASPRRAAPKGHTFIFRTAPHQGIPPTMKLLSALVAHLVF
jgi:hypothetical protein